MGVKTDIVEIIKEAAPGCIAAHERDGHDKLHKSDLEAIADAIKSYIRKNYRKY